MSEVKPEEVSGISIEGDLIVFAEAGHKGAKIFLLFAEYERVARRRIRGCRWSRSG